MLETKLAELCCLFCFWGSLDPTPGVLGESKEEVSYYNECPEIPIHGKKAGKRRTFKRRGCETKNRDK